MRNAKGQFIKGVHAWRKPRPHWDREWLDNEYTVKGRSAAEIAQDVSVTENAILHWLHKHDIPRRTVSEARAVKHWGASGERNPMYGKRGPQSPHWRGGLTPLRQQVYSSIPWAQAVLIVWERDGGYCTEPGCGKHDTNRRKMHVHHDKDFYRYPRARCDPRHLRLVCAKCHARIHREWRKGGDANAG